MVVAPEDRGRIAEYVKKHNLPTINANDKPVIPRISWYTMYGKRILDIIIAFIACVVTLPVNLVIGICTYFDVGSPVFFVQERPGKDCKPFKLVKFRNMRNAVDEKGYWLPISQRITKFGSFVRKTSLDELLNFYSILKGDMSLIGPRPLAMIYLDRFSDRHMQRHLVRPGLECPNIVNNGYGEGWHEQFENDIWYVENISFSTDCKMILLLVRMVFDKKVRGNHATIGPGDFIGYDASGRAFGANSIPSEYLEILSIEELR